jgi:DNA-binding NarL/FixJ family response regulator
MNIGIVEDSPLIQERLRRMLEQLPGARIVGMASDMKSAEQLLLQQDPDLPLAEKIEAVILDTQLSDGNCLALVKKMKHAFPKIKVVVFSNHASDEYRFLAQRAGADQFLDKSTDSELLIPLLQLWK